MGIGKTDGDGRRSAEHRLRREGLYPRVLSISIPHPALHKYIPHVFGGLMGGALEQEYKTTRLLLQIPGVHGLPVARRLALLGPLRARLRDARAVADKVQLVALELRLPAKRPAPEASSAKRKKKRRKKSKKQASD